MIRTDSWFAQLKDIHVQEVHVEWGQEKVLEHASDHVPWVKREKTRSSPRPIDDNDAEEHNPIGVPSLF